MLRKSLTLDEAREKAHALRKLAKAGADPVLERDRLRTSVPTFAEAVTATHEALKSGWNEKTDKTVLSSLKHHATPKLGTMWPAAGLMDTEIRCFHQPESIDATKEVQPRVQA